MKNKEQKRHTEDPLFIRESHLGDKCDVLWSLRRVNEYIEGRQYIRAVRSGKRLKQDIFTMGHVERIPRFMEFSKKYNEDEEYLLLASADGRDEYFISPHSLYSLISFDIFSMGGIKREQPAATFFPICTDAERNIVSDLWLHQYFNVYIHDKLDLSIFGIDQNEDVIGGDDEIERTRDRCSQFMKGESLVGKAFKRKNSYYLFVKQENTDVCHVEVTHRKTWLEREVCEINVCWRSALDYLEGYEPISFEEFSEKYKEAVARADELINTNNH